jgi:fructose-bisphosphate aldolase class I
MREVQDLGKHVLTSYIASVRLDAAANHTLTASSRFSTQLATIGVENSEDNRRALRELLFSTPGCEEHISGVVRSPLRLFLLLSVTRSCPYSSGAQIMYEETLSQEASTGVPFTQLLASKGVLAGIKLDTGTQPLPGGLAGETWTTGLDTLAKRAASSYSLGARFAKWRAVICIDSAQNLPSEVAVVEAAHSLARYARTCQEAGLVPIIEPEVLADGAHTMQECATVTERVLNAVFSACRVNGVLLPGCILKPNMIAPGLACSIKASQADVAQATLDVLTACVPGTLAGVLFLSGGQSEEEATANLAAIVAEGARRRSPWTLSFSYGRALQHGALRVWKGDPGNVAAAQGAFMTRCKANGKATRNEQ